MKGCEDAEDNVAKIADFWSDYLGYQVTTEDVPMMMALLKIARASTGKFKADNYIDLAGYCLLYTSYFFFHQYKESRTGHLKERIHEDDRLYTKSVSVLGAWRS